MTMLVSKITPLLSYLLLSLIARGSEGSSSHLPNLRHHQEKRELQELVTTVLNALTTLLSPGKSGFPQRFAATDADMMKPRCPNLKKILLNCSHCRLRTRGHGKIL